MSFSLIDCEGITSSYLLFLIISVFKVCHYRFRPLFIGLQSYFAILAHRKAQFRSSSSLSFPHLLLGEPPPPDETILLSIIGVAHIIYTVRNDM